MHAAIVRVLLEAGADPSPHDRAGRSALLEATSRGDRESVALLIDVARVHGVGSMALAPALFEAIGRSHDEIALSLLEAGADVHATDERDWTPLSRACARGRDSVASALLARGASARVRDPTGVTPLHQAARHGNEVLLQILLDADADPLARDRRGRTALFEALDGRHLDTARKLVSAAREASAQAMGAPRPVTPPPGHADAERRWYEVELFRALDSREIDTARSLLDAGVSVEAVDANGATPLVRVASRGDDAACTLLLEHGATPERQTANGVSPLMAAAGAGAVEVVDRLLALDASPHTRDRGGFGALHYAARAGSREAVERLLGAGANPAARSVAGQTAFAVAADAGHGELGELLGASRATVGSAAR